MNRRLTIVTSEPDASDDALGKLALFLGLEIAFTPLAQFDPARTADTGPVTAMSGRTLTRLLGRATAKPQAVLPRGTLLVRSFEPGSTLPTLLTQGQLGPPRVIAAGPQVRAYQDSLRPAAGPLAGLTETFAHADAVSVFTEKSTPSRLDHLVLVDGLPLLTRVRYGDTDLFLLADDSAVPDLDQRCEPDDPSAAPHATLLHLALFLRLAFGSGCWTDLHPSANLIIDDPMLRPRYGAIRYRDLLSEANAHDYAVTIAFIPFNHDRSDRRTVDFLRPQAGRFSIAVHGCDHTAGEFGAREPDRLLHLSRLAVSRMEDHERQTAMPFDPVMVFPQGVFAAPAFPALKRSGYHAVVNTELLPKDADAPSSLTFRDCIDGAIFSYGGFPLFRRHYPVGLFRFAVDLFWGRPALIVEHHGYFKNGYSHFAEFARGLRRLEPRLQWRPLGDLIVRQAHHRPVAPGEWAVKFFTPSFRLENPGDSEAGFLFQKRETEPDLVQQVTVDGRPVDFAVHDGVLTGQVRLAGRAGARIEIRYRPTPAPAYRFSARYRCSAAARRYLSEFRDNYIARHPRLLAVAAKLKRTLKGRR